jgi:hypothetical protein
VTNGPDRSAERPYGPDAVGPELAAEEIEQLVRLELEARVAEDHTWRAQIPGLPRTNAGGAAARAVYRTLLGRPEEGLAGIRDMLDDEAGFADGTLERAWYALVVGDRERAAAEATVAMGAPTESYVRGYRPFLRAILSLIAGDDAAAISWSEWARTEIGNKPSIAQMAPTSALPLPPSLVARDGAAFTSGLESLLAWHRRQIIQPRSPRYGNWDGFISVPAVVFARLAATRGLSTTVAAENHAAPAHLRLHHVDAWRGVLLPRAFAVPLETDLLPATWLEAAAFG